MSLPDFAPDRNQLEIDFAGLSFGTGEVLRYQYRLEGADDGWSAPSEQRSVTYASLAPGGYRFIVRAVNSDGIASAHPAVVTFTILRPLWLRWWFLCLSALAIGLHGHPPLPLPGRAGAGDGTDAHPHRHGPARRYRRQLDPHRPAQ